ncbi:MAG: SEC10/PgrA surface exclusion domain-containing protein [Lactobacillus sp.]
MRERRLIRFLLTVSFTIGLGLGLPALVAGQPVAAASTHVRMSIPKGYTIKRLKAAYAGHPSRRFVAASKRGMRLNKFSSNRAVDLPSDNNIILTPNRLTATQQAEITNFSLQLINQARRQLKLRPWVYSKGTQKLAADIAKNYQRHGRGIENGGHYIKGINRACRKHGLRLPSGNYVEDMAGFSNQAGSKTMTMTLLKKDIYFGLKQMLFGFRGPNDTSGQINQRNNYHEWEHAGDLLNTQNALHDGDYDYYGFSISRVKSNYSLHYVGVPAHVVNNRHYNRSFRP